MSNSSSLRSELVSYIQLQLFGPSIGECEQLVFTDPPHKRYILGVLYPREMEEMESVDSEMEKTSIFEADEDLGVSVGDSEEPDDSPLAAMLQRAPASAGFTFAVTEGSIVHFEAESARYEVREVPQFVLGNVIPGTIAKKIDTGDWSVEIGADFEGELDNSELTEESVKIGQQVDVKVIKVDEENRKVDLSLKQVTEDESVTKPKKVKRYCRIVLPKEIVTHSDSDGVTKESLFDDRAELRVRWRSVGDRRIVTASLVNKEVMKPGDKIDPEKCLFQAGLRVICNEGSFKEPPSPDVAFDEEEEELRLRYRKRQSWAVGHGTSVSWSSADPDGIPDQLQIDFTPIAKVFPFNGDRRSDASYDERVLKPAYLSSVESVGELKEMLGSYLDDFTDWLGRCSELDIDPIHATAFSNVLEKLGDQQKRLRHGVEVLCDPSNPECFEAFQLANTAMLNQIEATHRKKGSRFDSNDFVWYPFQLAFQLLAIPGIAEDGEESGRDLVDLLWFPTGGGKTEAYLLLSAFTIILRRKRYGDEGGGTAVLSRYTLRLLTAQQFERTSTLVCALEKLRRDGQIPGEEPITIGLWIGGSATSSPNDLKTAQRLYDEMREEETPINRFMLLSCPWCGVDLLPKRHSDDEADYGISMTPGDFGFRCTSSNCDFHDRIPVQVVDQIIYKEPPTILLGTIDKFARLPWEERSRALLGLGTSRKGPSLVIQDELHLISGPLGTVAAIYEAGIDVLLEHAGSRPKIIAATATIRGAEDQTRRLYGRDVRLFPASGPDADDSFFMKEERLCEDHSTGGQHARHYLGIMGQGHSHVTSSVRTMAAMLAGGGQVTQGDDFWTLVSYHNSKRELGKTLNTARNDVPTRIKQIVEKDPRKCEHVEELSGSIPSYRVPKVLQAVECVRSSGDSVDVLACTSMISVGVDVPRLNLMTIMGQPKTSAEYIQASSRVGRGRNAAGLVVVNFYPTRPRDRSHYESFVRFHDSIYRWVEPTSVTPHAPPALDRALHATMIMVIRLALLPKNDQAKDFNVSCPDTQDLLSKLLNRLQDSADTSERSMIKCRLDELQDWWASAAEKANLRYKAEPQFEGLMKFYGVKKLSSGKETLNSMRHVDGEAGTFVVGESRSGDRDRGRS